MYLRGACAPNPATEPDMLTAKAMWLCGYVRPALGAQEHRGETQIGDVDLLKQDTVNNPRTPRGSGVQMTFLGLLWLC